MLCANQRAIWLLVETWIGDSCETSIWQSSYINQATHNKYKNSLDIQLMSNVEYRAYLNICCELLWLMQLLYHNGVSQDSSIQVFTDSLSVSALANSSAFRGGTKQIEVHYHFIRELYHFIRELVE